MLIKHHNQLRWLVHSSDMIPLLTSGPRHWQVNIWTDCVFFCIASPFSALEVQVLSSVYSANVCACVCTYQSLCSPSSSVFLVCCGDLSAGSDSFPSKLHIPLPLCKLLKPDAQKGLCYDALLWADFIPWLERWPDSHAGWGKSPRGSKPLSLT